MNVVFKGRWKATLSNDTDGVKQVVEGDNVVTTVGKEFMASFLYSAAVAASTFTARYIAIGSGSTAEAAADTGMGTELARASGTVSYVSGQIFKVTSTFASGTGTGSVYEYGIFSSSTGGTLINRDTESVVNKGANDVLTVVCTLTLS